MRKQRRQNRIPEYDYSTAGAYFVTICTEHRKPLFGIVGADTIRPPYAVTLTPWGTVLDMAIQAIPQHYPTVSVDHYVIMPNHVHMIVRIAPPEADGNGRIISAPTLSTVVGSMKRWVSRQVGQPIWQRSYHDHVIRGEKDYAEIWQYIDDNPARWASDDYYIR